MVTGVYYSVTMKKPFNPYLGETCQGVYADGTKIYIEHIQHDPPLDAFLLVNEEKKIRIHGKLKTYSKLSPNEFVLKLKGVTIFDFDGSLIYAEMAQILNKGIMYGKRRLRLNESFVFYYPQAGLKGLIKIGGNEGVDQL